MKENTKAPKNEVSTNKPFHFAMMKDDLDLIARIQKLYATIRGKQAGGKRNIAVTIRLCMRVFSQLDLSIEKVRKINAEYEAEHPDCQPITIGDAE